MSSHKFWKAYKNFSSIISKTGAIVSFPFLYVFFLFLSLKKWRPQNDFLLIILREKKKRFIWVKILQLTYPFLDNCHEHYNLKFGSELSDLQMMAFPQICTNENEPSGQFFVRFLFFFVFLLHFIFNCAHCHQTETRLCKKFIFIKKKKINDPDKD